MTPSTQAAFNQQITNPMFELANLHQLNVKGANELSAQDTSENLVVHRPWIDEPSGSIPFDEQGGITLPVAFNVPAIVLEYKVEDGFDGVIKRLSCNVNFGGFVQFSGDIQWKLLQNGRAIRNFSNILAEKGTIQIPRDISPIRVYSGDLIQWVVTHVANGALAGQIICSLNGYTYPSKGVS